MDLILTVLGVFVLLLLSEAWFRFRKPRDEFSRKFIHITVGSFAAFWPFYLSWNTILLLSLAFVVVVSASKKLHVFKAIHAVERPTCGEVCFALAVGLLAFVTHQPWIYSIALLHMSLADGMAAIIGVTFGTSNRYKVLGNTKSVVGTATFVLVSVILLSIYGLTTHQMLPLAVVALTASASAAIENLAGHGLDNLFVPVLVAVMLTVFG
jgi:phytol kinase